MAEEYKKVVAVIFGGVSPEHDVSILSGLQIIEALDSSIYEPLPVYIDQSGNWFTGKELLNRKNYHFSSKTIEKLEQISFKIGNKFDRRPFFNIRNKSFFAKDKKRYFDIAFFALHGGSGENGQIQGAFAMSNVPFTGPNHTSSAIFMNKALTKNILKNHNIDVLDHQIVKKPLDANSLDKKNLTKDIKVKFPAFVKPCHLGSSIAVQKVDNNDELYDALLKIFRLDHTAIIEPFVKNLVEYNISVTKSVSNDVEISAIERPIGKNEFLSFKDKYLNSENSIDNKLSIPFGEGMASASREINPKISRKIRSIIEETAIKTYKIFNCGGAPRIDFLCNKKTGEIWLNEINPIPGSLGYYLWEGRAEKVSFTKLISCLIEESISRPQDNIFSGQDLRSYSASIFPQR